MLRNAEDQVTSCLSADWLLHDTVQSHHPLAVQHALSVAKSVVWLHWLPDIAYDVMLHTAFYCSIFTVITSADLANYMPKPPKLFTSPPPQAVMFVGFSMGDCRVSSVSYVCSG